MQDSATPLPIVLQCFPTIPTVCPERTDKISHNSLGQNSDSGSAYCNTNHESSSRSLTATPEWVQCQGRHSNLTVISQSEYSHSSQANSRGVTWVYSEVKTYPEKQSRKKPRNLERAWQEKHEGLTRPTFQLWEVMQRGIQGTSVTRLKGELGRIAQNEGWEERLTRELKREENCGLEFNCICDRLSLF